MLNALRLPVDWSRIKQLIWLRGNPATGGGYYNWLEESGDTPLLLKNAYPHKMQKCETNILPVQDLHGYDSPWPAGGGVNKFDESTVEFSRWISSSGSVSTSAQYGCISAKIPVAGGSACGIKCTSAPYSMSIVEYDSTDTFVTRNHISSNTELTATLGANTSYVIVQFSCGNDSSTVMTAEILAGYKAMFYLGSTAPASYSPYSNICPISGTDKVTVWTDSKYGGLVQWNQLITDGDFAQGDFNQTGGTLTVSNNTGFFTITNTSANTRIEKRSLTIEQGHKYYCTVTINPPKSTRVLLQAASDDASITIKQETISAGAHVLSEIKTMSIDANRIRVYVNRDADLAVDDTVTFNNLMLCDLTAMFGAGNEPATVEEFRALFPLDFYAYNAGEVTNVSDVSNLPYVTATIQFGSTYYGGTVDLATGVLTVTHMSQDGGSVDWTKAVTNYKTFTATINNLKYDYNKAMVLSSQYTATSGNAASSSADCYVWANGTNSIAVKDTSKAELTESEFKTAMTGVQFVYELTTPTTIQLDPVTLSTLRGDNWIWSDCGNQMAVTYATSYSLETLTATGSSPLLLQNSQNKKLVQCDVGIVATQEGSGDPYPAGGGANKWDEEWEAGRLSPTTGEPTENESGIRSKNYIPVVSGETYYIYCGTTVSNDFRILFYDADKTFLSASAWVYAGTTFSITGSYANVAYVKFFVTGGMYGNVYKNDIAINLPSNVTTYSPYSNIRPIHGVSTLSTTIADNSAGTGGTTYSTVFGCMGANQWDEEWRNGYYNSTTGVFNAVSSYFANKNPISVKPSTSYYIGSSVNATWEVFYYDSDMTYLSYDAKTNAAFTTPSNCAYINFSGATTFYGTTYNHDIAINLPSSVTTYQPYVNECYGGTYDAVTGTLTLTHKIIDLGTLNWNNGGNFKLFFSTGINAEIKLPASNADAYSYGYCDAFQFMSYNAIGAHTSYKICVSVAGSVGVNDGNQYASLNAFKTAMSGIHFCYELATPITKNYDPHAIKSLAGHTYVLTNGGGNITVQYKGITPEN